MKRERDGASRAGEAGDPSTTEEDHQKGNSSTEEVDRVVSGEDEEDEEEQGSKRARVELVGNEANQERMEVKEELEFHAAAWRREHLGKRGELQPARREREAELPGDHATSVDSSGRHIIVEGTEGESLARLASTEADDEERKLVYSLARMVVRPEPTPA